MLFRSDYKHRIISLTLAGVLLLDTLVYANELPKEHYLRPKLLTSESDGVERVKEGLTKRKFIKYLAAGIGMAVVGGGIHIYDKADYFSFNKPKILTEEPADYDMRVLINELTLIKAKKMPYKEVKDYCEKIKIRLQNKMVANIAAFGEITYDKYMQNILPYLLNFLTNEDVNGLDCVSTKWEINLVKEGILQFLSEMLVDRKIERDIVALVIKNLGKYLEYEDNFKGGDTLFNKYFPKIDPKEVLSFSLRQTAEYWLNQIKYEGGDYPSFRRELASGQLSIMKPLAEDNLPMDVVYRFFLLCGTPRYIENTLSMIRHIEAEDIHYVLEEDIDAIKELQRLPKNIRAYCVESALAHNLPPRLLVGSIISNSTRRNYNLGATIRISRKRGVISEATEKFLLKKIPYWFLRRTYGAKLNDLVGGVFFDGKTTIGILQMRPAWVRRYKGWERFGIDAEKLSNREIAWKLLEPKYAIEAVAKMWCCLIEETKKTRESAIKFNKEIDVSAYAREVGASYLYHMVSVEGYKWIPDPLIFGKEEWIITGFHPVYCNWPEAKSQLEWQRLISQSGILDENPVKFIRSDKDRAVQDRRGFLLSIIGSL